MTVVSVPCAGGRKPDLCGTYDLFRLVTFMVQARSAAPSGSLLYEKNRAKDLCGRSSCFS